MTKTDSSPKTTRKLSQANENTSDEAPMVFTRLSGWIGSAGERKPLAAWIVPTRVSDEN